MALNHNKIYNYFQSTFELRESTNGWFRFDDAKAVNFEFLVVKNFKEGTKQSALNFIMDFEFLEFYDALTYIDSFDEIELIFKREVAKKTVELPEYFIPLKECQKAIDYLVGRGLTEIDKYNRAGFGYCYDGEYAGYLIVPLMKRGKLDYFIARNVITDDYLRYKNPPIPKSASFFNEDAIDLYQDIFIVEGFADALSIGDNAIATLGLGLTPGQTSVLMNSGVKNITFIPDKGAWNKWLKHAGKLSNDFNVDLYCLEDFETGKDVNKIGFENILKTKKLKYHINLYL